MRSSLAALAALLGFLVTVAALVAHLAHDTLLDPERAGELVSEAVDRQSVREDLLARAIPGYAALPSTYRTEVERITTSRRVQRALREVEVDARGHADVSAVRRAVARALRDRGHDTLAAHLAAGSRQDTVRLPGRLWRPFTDARETAGLVASRGAWVAAGLFLTALVVSTRRRGTLAGIGLALVAAAVLAGAVLWWLPTLAAAVTDHPWLRAVAPAAAAEPSLLVAELLPVGVVGVLLLLLAPVLPRTVGD